MPQEDALGHFQLIGSFRRRGLRNGAMPDHPWDSKTSQKFYLGPARSSSDAFVVTSLRLVVPGCDPSSDPPAGPWPGRLALSIRSP
jgi:hypothetical protein